MSTKSCQPGTLFKYNNFFSPYNRCGNKLGFLQDPDKIFFKSYNPNKFIRMY